jgi:hypothetical protein
MAELDHITEALRRQRKDLADSMDETTSRKSETAALLDRIEQLRERSAKTRRAYGSPAEEREPGETT